MHPHVIIIECLQIVWYSSREGHACQHYFNETLKLKQSKVHYGSCTIALHCTVAPPPHPDMAHATWRRFLHFSLDLFLYLVGATHLGPVRTKLWFIFLPRSHPHHMSCNSISNPGSQVQRYIYIIYTWDYFGFQYMDDQNSKTVGFRRETCGWLKCPNFIRTQVIQSDLSFFLFVCLVARTVNIASEKVRGYRLAKANRNSW